MGTIRVMVPQLMAEHGINKTKLAKLLGISRPTAGKLARGEWPWIRSEQLAKMCEIFDAQPGDILVYRPEGEDR